MLKLRKLLKPWKKCNLKHPPFDHSSKLWTNIHSSLAKTFIVMYKFCTSHPRIVGLASKRGPRQVSDKWTFGKVDISAKIEVCFEIKITFVRWGFSEILISEFLLVYVKCSEGKKWKYWAFSWVRKLCMVLLVSTNCVKG